MGIEAINLLKGTRRAMGLLAILLKHRMPNDNDPGGVNAAEDLTIREVGLDFDIWFDEKVFAETIMRTIEHVNNWAEANESPIIKSQGGETGEGSLRISLANGIGDSTWRGFANIIMAMSLMKFGNARAGEPITSGEIEFLNQIHLFYGLEKKRIVRIRTDQQSEVVRFCPYRIAFLGQWFLYGWAPNGTNFTCYPLEDIKSLRISERGFRARTDLQSNIDGTIAGT